jgi:peptidoglycan/xylan/chitin deacetylase (PgdA/CDA1 family)
VASAALIAAIVIEGRDTRTNHAATRSRPVPAKKRRAPVAAAPSRRVRGPHDRPVPILMYHVVESPPASAVYPQLYVSASDFGAQMRALARRGFHGVTLGRVFDYWRRSIALPRRPIVISFDDGYESQYRNAFPVLQQLGWPGVLNLVTKNERPSWGLPPVKLRKLVTAGWELDAHTIHHLDLTELDPVRLRHELSGSRRLIQRQFGVPADFFCYPSGRLDATVVAAVRRAGYRGATTERPGLAHRDQPFLLARIRVDGADGASGLRRKLHALGQ